MMAPAGEAPRLYVELDAVDSSRRKLRCDSGYSRQQVLRPLGTSRRPTRVPANGVDSESLCIRLGDKLRAARKEPWQLLGPVLRQRHGLCDVHEESIHPERPQPNQRWQIGSWIRASTRSCSIRRRRYSALVAPKVDTSWAAGLGRPLPLTRSVACAGAPVRVSMQVATTITTAALLRTVYTGTTLSKRFPALHACRVEGRSQAVVVFQHHLAVPVIGAPSLDVTRREVGCKTVARNLRVGEGT